MKKTLRSKSKIIIYLLKRKSNNVKKIKIDESEIILENYNYLQATTSNLLKAHGGTKPLFAKYFDEEENPNNQQISYLYYSSYNNEN